MSTLEDFDRILAELSPPGGSASAPSAPATTTVSASVTVSSPVAHTTVQPPRPSVSVASAPAPASSGSSSNASKIAELESLLADLGPVHLSGGSSAAAAAPRTTTPPAAGPSSFTSTSATSNSSSNSVNAPRATAPTSSSTSASHTSNSSHTNNTSGSHAAAPHHGGSSTTTTTTTTTTSSQSSNNGARAPQAPGSPATINSERGRTASFSVAKPAASSDSIVCGKCHEKITGTYIAALDRNWHPDHFTCSSCSKSLDGNFFETDKGILCTECASEQIRCSECKLPITGTHLIYSDGRPVHNDCVPKSTCGRCHNILSLGDAHVEALDKLWHTECFACTRCMTPLGSTFVQYEGTPYCQPCIQILSKERNIVFKS